MLSRAYIRHYAKILVISSLLDKQVSFHYRQYKYLFGSTRTDSSARCQSSIRIIFLRAALVNIEL